MLSSHYPTSPDESSETFVQSSCGANIQQPSWGNIEINPWITSEMHPSMIGSSIPSDGRYDTMANGNNTWGQPIAIPTSAPDQSWANPYDYGSMNHHNHIQTSRDASPNEDYFGAVDYNNHDQSSGSWDPSDPMFSPYSEVPPPIAGLSNSTNMSISPMNPPHTQYPYSSAQIPGTTSISSSPPNLRINQQSSSTKKPSSKSKSPKSSSSKSASNKRKARSTSSSSKHASDPSNMGPPHEVHRIASENISREAWRICKAEVIEMERQRIQLLQNSSGKLEQEILEQRNNLSMIRQGVMREQGVLEDALRRAEKLGRV